MSPVGIQTDNQHLSPFAQLMSTLQQLQQSDPAKYQQVTQQIATNLQAAAQTDLANGNSAGANQLNQLATDFSNASKNGQLPNVQDLAQAVGGHHHHHHHAASADAGSSAGSSASSNTPSQPLSQFLASLQANGAQSDALNPMSIIMNTLSDAGISGSSL
jgi:predicted ATPase